MDQDNMDLQEMQEGTEESVPVTGSSREVMMYKGKIFLDSSDVAKDLETDQEDAERIIKELNERIVRLGGMCIGGKVSTAFYLRMKDTGFTSAEGSPELDTRSLTEKRLLNIKEFCFYSNLGKDLAREFAQENGLAKRIGRRVLYDRVLFDEWCDNNKG
jgi:hypothetical protein